MPPSRVAYIVSRFPHLTETFILREMAEVERQGLRVSLYPLIRQEQGVRHDDARVWTERMQYVPFASREVVAANWEVWSQRPRLAAGAAMYALWENRASLNFLSRALVLLPKALEMARRMQREGITHIHAHYATHPTLVAWLIYRIAGISYSVTVHAHDIFVRRSMLATKLKDASFIVAISEYNREYLSRTLGSWVLDKIFVIHCGINPQHYRPAPALPVSGQPFEIICVGSLQPYKGHKYLVAACALLRDRNVPFRCRIIGEGEEGSVLEWLIRDRGLAGSVELLGARTESEVAALLSTAHCYVQPSIVMPNGKMEGVPVALMEALASKLPVIATGISGVPELVCPGETGVLVPPADSLALAAALCAQYEDPSQGIRMAQRGRTLVLREYGLQANVARLVSLFEQVAALTKREACSMLTEK